VMKNAWYILNYHDISWEENDFLKGIGGSFPPDIFREHLTELSQHARLVSVQEGFTLYCSGNITEPLVSFWFDDGFTGVRKYAMPIMDSYGIFGAISIDSRFTLREEMFWRLKLSFIAQTDGLRFLRSKLKKHGYTLDKTVKGFVMDHFSLDIVDIIDSVYEMFVSKHVREDAFRLFDTMDGIQKLYQHGWEISNHTTSHYPVAEESHISYFKEDFDVCEQALQKHLNIETKFWVIPFDRQNTRSERLKEVFYDSDDKNRYLVLVGNKSNQIHDPSDRIIHRIEPPYVDGKGLVRYLKTLD